MPNTWMGADVYTKTNPVLFVSENGNQGLPKKCIVYLCGVTCNLCLVHRQRWPVTLF